MESKPCRECKHVKPLVEFYEHPRMADGRLNKCKPCVRARVTEYRNGNIERVRLYDRERYKRPERRAYTDGRAIGYIAAHPRARAAHTAVSNAIRDGRLFRKPCEVCGGTVAVHAHHDDYDKPLEVRWLCVPHHAGWHQDNGPGKNLG